MSADEANFLLTGLRDLRLADFAMGEDACSICLADLNDGNNYHIVQIRDCSHVFHRTCLLSWICSTNYMHSSCPYCRVEMFPSRYADEEYDDWQLRPVPDQTRAETSRVIALSFSALQEDDELRFEGTTFASRLGGVDSGFRTLRYYPPFYEDQASADTAARSAAERNRGIGAGNRDSLRQGTGQEIQEIQARLERLDLQHRQRRAIMEDEAARHGIERREVNVLDRLLRQSEQGLRDRLSAQGPSSRDIPALRGDARSFVPGLSATRPTSQGLIDGSISYLDLFPYLDQRVYMSSIHPARSRMLVEYEPIYDYFRQQIFSVTQDPQVQAQFDLLFPRTVTTDCLLPGWPVAQSTFLLLHRFMAASRRSEGRGGNGAR